MALPGTPGGVVGGDTSNKGNAISTAWLNRVFENWRDPPDPLPRFKVWSDQKLTRLTITTDSDSAARLTTAGGALELDIQDSVMGSHPVMLAVR